jgi:hypothetical protein
MNFPLANKQHKSGQPILSLKSLGDGERALHAVAVGAKLFSIPLIMDTIAIHAALNEGASFSALWVFCINALDGVLHKGAHFMINILNLPGPLNTHLKLFYWPITLFIFLFPQNSHTRSHIEFPQCA